MSHRHTTEEHKSSCPRNIAISRAWRCAEHICFWNTLCQGISARPRLKSVSLLACNQVELGYVSTALITNCTTYKSQFAEASDDKCTSSSTNTVNYGARGCRSSSRCLCSAHADRGSRRQRSTLKSSFLNRGDTWKQDSTIFLVAYEGGFKSAG